LIDAAGDEAAPAADYLDGVRGHAVLAFGVQRDGAEGLAVWRLGPAATASGAWVIPADRIEPGSEPFTSVLATLRGRALVDWGDGQTERALRVIAPALPPAYVERLSAAITPIPDLLKEIGDLRQGYEDALDRHRTTNAAQVLPLSWTEEVPGEPDTARAALTPIRWAAGRSVDDTALGVAAAMKRSVALWQDTESLRYRRPYLRSTGRPQVLPPQWTARLRALTEGRELLATHFH
jgi:hypothetical protein